MKQVKVWIKHLILKSSHLSKNVEKIIYNNFSNLHKSS
jgi:hypothetical protein